MAPWHDGIRTRFVVAALAGAVVAILILAVGVLIVAADTFTKLMAEHGSSTTASEEMFGESVSRVFLIAVVVAAVASVALAAGLARRLARPLGAMRDAARRIAEGDYLARIPPRGPEEIASLADSFNRMAASLQEQERVRRDFIVNASHELRTPLTNLRGYLEALRDGVIPPTPETFTSLSEEVDRLNRLAESLAVLAEGDAPATADAVDVDVGAAVRAAVELAEHTFERAGVTLTTSIADGLWVRAGVDHLPRVMGNLLQNAARYTPRGGWATVEAAAGRGRLEGGPAEVVIRVTNSGPAIPTDDLPHLFDRFYRVEKSRDAARGGAGIGLAIVRGLVEADGGTVGVASRDGETQFWFTLPA